MHNMVEVAAKLAAAEARKRAIGYVFKAAEVAAVWIAAQFAHIHIHITF